jgi:hypothetical protein
MLRLIGSVAHRTARVPLLYESCSTLNRPQITSQRSHGAAQHRKLSASTALHDGGAADRTASLSDQKVKTEDEAQQATSKATQLPPSKSSSPFDQPRSNSDEANSPPTPPLPTDDDKGATTAANGLSLKAKTLGKKVKLKVKKSNASKTRTTKGQKAGMAAGPAGAKTDSNGTERLALLQQSLAVLKQSLSSLKNVEPPKKASSENEQLASEVGFKAKKPSKKSKSQVTKSAKPKSQEPSLLPKGLEGMIDNTSPQGHIHTLDASSLSAQPFKVEQPPIPKLQYNLDRVLFNSGVYQLQDSRTEVYNFDPYLASIMPVEQFDFNALKRFVSSSEDQSLSDLAKRFEKRYISSTSSLTGMLAHFHYLLSEWRPISTSMLSANFVPESTNFTRINRSPAAGFLHWRGDHYALDADKEFDTGNILSMLGRSLEKLLTLKTSDYEKYTLKRSHEITPEERDQKEAYHYTGFGDFLVRSQLDSQDARLPGSGIFDLKTRAVVSIRMDARDFKKGLGYELKSRLGQWESYEREYYDLIRAAFLKYSLQVRMGRMDGIFVAFHNVQRIFGFQYIPLEEMDKALHGNSTVGEQEHLVGIKLLNELLDRAAQKFPGRSLRVHVETRPSEVAPFMYFFAKPVTKEDVNKVQAAAKASVEAFEQEVLGMRPEDTDAEDGYLQDVETDHGEAIPDGEFELLDEDEDVGDSGMAWTKLRSKVAEMMEDEALGIAAVREELEDALEESGLLRKSSPEDVNRYVEELLGALINPEGELIDGQTRNEEEIIASEADDKTIFKDENCLAEEGEDTVELESESSSIGAGIGEQAAVAKDTDDDTPSVQDKVDVGEMVNQYPQEDGSEEDSLLVEPDGEEAADEVETSKEGNSEDTEGNAPSTRRTGSGDLSIGDLVIKLAARVRPSSAAETEAATQDESEPDNTKANRRFERILSRLVATVKRTADPEKPETPISETETEEPPQELLGLVLTVRNKVNGKYKRFDGVGRWQVEYAIEELKPERAVEHYRHLLARRRKLLAPERDEKKSNWNSAYLSKLWQFSREGRRYRLARNSAAKGRPVWVLGELRARKYQDVFPKEDSSKARPLGAPV